MEVSAQIKKYRSHMGISQEELAEKVYVSRQTVSNWETGKNYPDIHSILLLSSFFNVSLDQLVKGDVEIMKKEIKENVYVWKCSDSFHYCLLDGKAFFYLSNVVYRNFLGY